MIFLAESHTAGIGIYTLAGCYTRVDRLDAEHLSSGFVVSVSTEVATRAY